MNYFYRPEINACDNCGACCIANPCLLRDAKDVSRLAKHFGVTKKEYARKNLQLEWVKGDKYQVRMKRGENGCQYHVNNLCAVHEVKPTGAKHYKCWDKSTFAGNLFWDKIELNKIGYNLA